MRGKQDKLTLRDLVLTCYLQEVSRSHSKLGNEPKKEKSRRTHEQAKDGMLESGKNIKELIKRKKKTESRNTSENYLHEDRPEAESKM